MKNTYTEVVIDLMMTGNYVVERLSSFFKEYDLTVPQYNILRILRGQEDVAINLYELQEHMIHKMSNTTRLVEKLRKKELLLRKPCDSNRRKIEISITEQGLVLLSNIDNKLAEFEKDLVSNLTEEESIQLVTLLNKVKQ